MSLVTRSLPGLFGGVSQQVPALRHPTHCSVQDNALATLVAGLFKRPGSRHAVSVPMTGNDGQSVLGSYGKVYAHPLESGGKRVQLLLVNGNALLYDMELGTSESVSFPNGKTYLNASDPENDFRCITVADYTFIVNRKKTVKMLPYTTPANPKGVAYVHIRTAVPNVAYKAIVNGVLCEYKTGNVATSDGIATSLASAINSNTSLTGFTAYHMGGNIVKVTRADGADFTCTSEDGWGNQATQTLHLGVDAFSALPKTFEEGYVVTITGDLEGGKNKYYVKFVNDRWTECQAPGVQTKLDPGSMPHQLRPAGDGTWVFEQCVWDERKVGDDETNPLPSFVDTTLRSAFFFRNRLGLLADDAVILSRAGQYFNYFASSAVQVLDTDPIDLGATSEQVVALEWAVPFNLNLLVWAADKQQFVLTGGDILSPNNARLMPSTTFEWDARVKPAALGNKVLFLSKLGEFSQVNLFRVSDDTVTNMAEDVTEHCPEYVPASPRMLVASTLFKAAVVVPSGVTNELYFFKYELDERDKLSQKAWCRIRFETVDTIRILNAHWDSRTLYLLKHITSPADSVPGGRLVLEALDFSEKAMDEGAGFGIRLDNRVSVTAGAFDGTNTVVDVPYLVGASELVMLKCVAGKEPVPLTVTSFAPDVTNVRTRVYVEGNHSGALVAAGRPFKMTYKLTEPVLRDNENVPIMAATVKLVRWVVRYVSTGWFTAKVTPMLRATYEYPFSGRTIGQPGQGPTQLALSTGEFAIPVQAQAANTDVVIESDSYLPCNIPYAEWVGDVNLKARR